MKNGRDKGREYLAMLQSFIQAGTPIPLGRDGDVNKAELSRITGIPTNSFYQNEDVRLLCESLKSLSQKQALREKSVGPANADQHGGSARTGTQQLQRLERKLNTLEQQNAVIVAENHMLRKQVKDLLQQLGRQDMMIDTGKRIVTPPAGD
ncbi:hypothetical protein [Paraburkholderia sp. RL17-337-BIB-A]|uniref:hypothetical protein n=1 Tax=Paraburkholderia sp. RL17-337-BIB-A TaxID=3031636 RepID=UPI0038BD79F5